MAVETPMASEHPAAAWLNDLLHPGGVRSGAGRESHRGRVGGYELATDRAGGSGRFLAELTRCNERASDMYVSGQPRRPEFAG